MEQNTNKIDWLNHSLEFVVVIVGILLAFQLNRWATEKEQLQTIDTHRSHIKEESEFNKQNFEDAIAYATSNISKLDSILKLIEEKADNVRINQLALELLNLGGVYIRKNAYSTLTESGDIRFMKNFSQKQNIINLYEYYKWVEAFELISNNLYMNDYYPYLKDNFDLVNGSTQSREIYHSKVFRNILGAYKRTSQNRLDKYKDCHKEINEYLEN